MITVDDLKAAIAECEGERNPNANTCMKLSAYYILLREKQGAPEYAYSGSPAPVSPVKETVEYYSDTEFAAAIEGKNLNQVLALIDELMSTVEIINKRLYLGVMQRLHDM